MNIIQRVNPFWASLFDRRELRYAAKHRMDSELAVHGSVTVDHYRDGNLIHTQTGPNIFTTEGRARILNIVFRAQTTESAIYLGIFKSNVTPAAANTAAACLGAAGTYGECQDADYGTPATDKPEYTIAATTSEVATNAAAAASFTMAASITVYGAFLSTVGAKTATTGTLLCGKALTTPRAVINLDVLAVTYVLTLSSS